MTKIISVEEIGQCRSGPDNDIDLQAVFGGIKGRQQKGLKVNPLYDSNHGNITTQNVTPDINGNINNIHVVTYKSIPGHIHDEETPVAKDTSDLELQKDSNGNESIDTKENIKIINEITGKNGNVKAFSFPSETDGKANKTKTMPEHLGMLELNGNPKDVIPNGLDVTHPSIGKVSKSDRNVKPSSSYKLLAYSNDAFTKDDVDNRLETIDNGYDGEDNPGVKTNDIALDVRDDDDIHVNDHEIHREVKSNSKYETQIKEEKKEDKNQFSVKSKTIVSVESSEKCATSIMRTPSSFSSTSEQSVKTEFVTEVHVHTTEINQNHSTSTNHDLPSSEQETPQNHTAQHDDTDIHNTEVNTSGEGVNVGAQEGLGAREGESIVSFETVNEHFDDTSNESRPDKVKNSFKEKSQTDATSSKTVTFTNEESEESVISNGNEVNSSSARTIKSILLTTNGKQITPPSSPKCEHVERRESFSEIQECKSVTFSDDTVFNENKSKRYKLDRMEKVNLRDIYRGKISSDTAMAKMNPLFTDDGENLEGERSMSEDERIAYQIALKKVMKSTKGKGKKLDSAAYKDHFLILKANGIKPANVNADDLPADIEQPAYDRLIQRTIAKERRKLIIKWTLVIITVAIVTAVATVLGVHFKDSD